MTRNRSREAVREQEPAEHWSPRCVICATLGRDRQLEHGHVCPPCRTALRVDLLALVDLAAIAAVIPDPWSTRPRAGTSRPAPTSRPPIDLAHVDPELVLVRCDPDDASSDVPLLTLLEDWCRVVRQDRGLAPYGLATEAAAVTLSGTVGWLARHVDWMCDEPEFAVEQLAGQIRRAEVALRALDADEQAERHAQWTVPCPADAPETGQGRPDSGERGGSGTHGPPTAPEPSTAVLEPRACGHRLRLTPGDLHSTLWCPRCRTEWTAQRLLLSALSDPRVTIWAYPGDVTEALGIPARTLRDWRAKGRIEAQGSRVDAGAAFRLRHAAGVA